MTDTNLTKAGFTLLDKSIIRKRLIVAVSAFHKFGKTHFGLTAPGPITHFDIDRGTEGVIEKFVTAKQIYHFPMEVPSGEKMQEEATETWNTFQKLYDIALANSRSVVVDTASELWEILRIARFGRLSSVMPYQYTPVNAEFNELFYKADSAIGTNVIFLHRMKSEYVNDKFTGHYIPSWMNKTPYKVHVVGTLRRYEKDDDAGIKQTEVRLRIDDCRHNMPLIGRELPAVFSNFPMMAQMVIPGTTEEDWT